MDAACSILRSWWGLDLMWQTPWGEQQYHVLLALGMMISGTSSFISLFFLVAPYGRHAKEKAKGWGPLVPAKLAWIIMESPSPILCCYLWLYHGDPAVVSRAENRILLACFLLHYINRAFIFPMRMRGGAPMPVSVMLMAFTFTSCNGYLQGRSISHFRVFEEGWSSSPQFAVGVALFLLGWLGNNHADHVLLNLRKPGEVGVYRIPRGGLFELVTAANYFAEIVEWSGFAIACADLPSFAFAYFTFCNLAPRGATHHQWYLSKFKEEYPKNRKAVIPFLW